MPRVNGKNVGVLKRERTSSQYANGIAVINFPEKGKGGELEESRQTVTNYERWREIRKDPTIFFLRQAFVAPALFAGWTYEIAENSELTEEQCKDLKISLEQLRVSYVRKAMLGCIDYGWQPFEVVYGFTDGEEGKLLTVQKLKPLIQDRTVILVDTKTGEFLGFHQELDEQGFIFEEVNIHPPKSLLHNIEVEGTNWYGQGILEILDDTQKQCQDVAESSSRFDRKVAGANWIIKYPVGTSTYNGAETDNYVIAQNWLNRIESSGGMAIPKEVKKEIDEFQSDINDTDRLDWDIELVSVSGGITDHYTDRCAYIDKLKARAFGFTERSVFEGEHGTKAEAETHTSIPMLNIVLRHDEVIERFNTTVLNFLTEFNFGVKNQLKVKSKPLIDSEKELFKELYLRLIVNQEFLAEALKRIDINSLYERLNIPINPDFNPETDSADFTNTEIDSTQQFGDAGEEQNSNAPAFINEANEILDELGAE